MELMRLRGNRLLSKTWKQELTVTEKGVEWEQLLIGQRTDVFIPFNRIAQVTLISSILTASLIIESTGGSDKIEAKALKKSAARTAKDLINAKIG
jgi:hypothetical protein